MRVHCWCATAFVPINGGVLKTQRLEALGRHASFMEKLFNKTIIIVCTPVTEARGEKRLAICAPS